MATPHGMPQAAWSAGSEGKQARLARTAIAGAQIWGLVRSGDVTIDLREAACLEVFWFWWFRLTATHHPSPPLRYYCSSDRGYSLPLSPAAVSAILSPSSRHSSLSRQMRTLPAAPDYGNFAFHLASPRPLRGRAILRGDAAADLPSPGGVGPSPPRLRRRGGRVRHHAQPFATEAEEDSNPLPATNIATVWFASISDNRRRHQIHTDPLRFGVLGTTSPLLKVLPS
jgi:hypothetical protein